MFWLPLGIGAAIGLAKSFIFDSSKEGRQRKLAGATERYSPWTGLHAAPVEEADPFGQMLGGAQAGASIGALGAMSGWFDSAADQMGAATAASASAGKNLGGSWSGSPKSYQKALGVSNGNAYKVTGNETSVVDAAKGITQTPKSNGYIPGHDGNYYMGTEGNKAPWTTGYKLMPSDVPYVYNY